MRHVGRFLLFTLVHGILFLVPLVLVAVLAREGYRILHRLSQPVARLLPDDRFFGVLAEDLVSIIAIILLFLIAGLFAGTRPGRLLSDRLERAVLYRVPGYLLVRGAVGSFPGLSTEMRPEPSLVETDDGWAFALLVEREPPGFCTVFLPDSPTPTSGSVRIVEATRVQVPRRLDAEPAGLPDPVRHRGGCTRRAGSGRPDGSCRYQRHDDRDAVGRWRA